jgi:hypothetical protein
LFYLIFKSYAESEVESLSEYTEKEQDSATSDANETQSNQLLIGIINFFKNYIIIKLKIRKNLRT